MAEGAQRHVKMISLRVGYKSTTVPEFIERHALDVGRSGIYIKTTQPFPVGSLLRLQVQLADGHVVISAIGSVAWMRDARDERLRPAGMGVRFVKTDEASKKLLDTLAGARADAGLAYDEGLSPRPSSVPPTTHRTSMFPPSASTAPASDEATVVTRMEDVLEELVAPTTRLHRNTLMGVGSPRQVVAPSPEAGALETRAQREPSHSDEPTVIKKSSALLEESLREPAPSMPSVVTSNVVIGDLPLSALRRTAKPGVQRSAKRRAIKGIRELIGAVAVCALAITTVGDHVRLRAAAAEPHRDVAIVPTSQTARAPKDALPQEPPATLHESAAPPAVLQTAEPSEAAIADAGSQVAARTRAPAGRRATGTRWKTPVTKTKASALPRPKWLVKPGKEDNPY